MMTAKHLPHVDAMRGVAIALVVIFHAFPAALPGGFLGIDVFFVISGYVITRQIAGQLGSGNFSYREFIVRRIFRLVPAAIACFLVTTLAAVVLLTPDELERYARSLIAVVLIAANFFFYRHSDYFSPDAYEMPLQHTWSLAVEEQFYLIWPLALSVLWALTSGRRRSIAVTAAGLFAISLAGAQFAVVRDPSFAYYMLPTRAWELLAGCILALTAFSIQNPRSAAMASGVGMIAILTSALLLGKTSGVPGIPALPAVAGTVLLIAAGGHIQGAAGRILNRGALVWLGLISYSLYLWHWPLFSLWQMGTSRPLSVIEGVGLIALAIAIATFSLTYIETPLRRLPTTNSFRPLRHSASAIASALALGGLAGLIIAGDGLPWRYDGVTRRMLEQMATSNELRSVCDGHENALRRDQRCNIGVQKPDNASFDMVLLGDSIADQYTALGAIWAKEKGYSARQVTNSACAFVIGARRLDKDDSHNSACEAYHLVVGEFLDKNPDLKIAIVGSDWAGSYGPVEPNAAAALVGMAGKAGTYEDFAAASIRMLRARGIRVVVIGQAPMYGRLPVRCLVTAAGNADRADACSLPVGPFLESRERSARLFTKLAAEDPGVSYYDIGQILCDDKRCRPFKDGTFFYRDAGHFNADGVRALAKFFRPPP